MNSRKMLKSLVCLLFVWGMICINSADAQQSIAPKKMNYFNIKYPNDIVYNDTLYSGSRAFRKLFYRTGDLELRRLYKKHQSNKIWGNALNIIGLATAISGVEVANNNHNSRAIRSDGWWLAGLGIVTSGVGGYLMEQSQNNLTNAVKLFNVKYATTSTSLSVNRNNIGLVLNF